MLRKARRRAAAAVGRGPKVYGRLPPYLTHNCEQLEFISRAHSRSVYVGEATMLCWVLGRYLVYADARETGITPHLAMHGYWESWITLALARAVRPGAHCLDVGANHGYYTLLMRDAAGPEGRVAAVEPTPRLAELVRQTVDVNAFPEVEVVAKAASDTDGERLQLVIPPGRSLNAHLSDIVVGENVPVQVESVTIDSLTQDWPRVDVIKVDVEGSEERVWRGMRETIARNRDVLVVFELNVERCKDPRAFVEEIEDAGFPLRHLDDEGEPQPVSRKELLNEQVGRDWMLYLTRR